MEFGSVAESQTFLFSKRSQLAAKSEEKRMFSEANFIPKIICERSDEYET